MDKLLPIVPGCLCVVVRSKAGNRGKALTALRLATETELDAVWFVTHKGPVWRVSVALKTICGHLLPYSLESNLLRIDGHQPDEQDITEKEKEDAIL